LARALTDDGEAPGRWILVRLGDYGADHSKGLFETVDTRVFLEQPVEANGTQFKLLAKQ